MTASICTLQNRDHFPTWLNEAGLVGQGAELGVFEGQFSAHLLAHWKGQKLYGVDPFVHQPVEQYHDGANRPDLPQIGVATQRRFANESRYELIIAESLTAVKAFEDGALDFVHIDANHDLKHTREDIAAWWPKVKSGGVFSGHDAYLRADDGMNCGVLQAVCEFVYANNLSVRITPCTSWWIIKP